MIIKKTIQVAITKKEQEILQKAEGIFDEICNNYHLECEECPLYQVCKSMNCNSPSNVLYHCIKALPVED